MVESYDSKYLLNWKWCYEKVQSLLNAIWVIGGSIVAGATDILSGDF